MTTYSWANTRTTAIKTFGQTPRADQEQEIIDVFKEHPALVVTAIDKISDDISRGQNIRSGWGILLNRVRNANNALHEVVVEGNDRENAIRLAETWIRTAGIHHDRESEVTDELFGDRGRLRHWRTDERLKQRMLDLWHEQRPRGEQVELEAQQRADHWRSTRAEVLARLAAIKARHADTPAGADDDNPF